MMRSLLFVPADSARKREGALRSAADALIFDLEDSVSPINKDEARKQLGSFLAQRRTEISQQVFIRINDLGSGMSLDDLVMTIPFQPTGYVLPKCRGGEDVHQLSRYLDAFEKCHPPAGQSARIIGIATENASSVFGMNSYKGCSDRLLGLMWGAEDLSADIGASASRHGAQWSDVFRLARSLCVLAAANAEVLAIDTIPAELRNDVALRLEATQARHDGFTAKAAIHPAQVEVINEAMMPDPEEVAWARQVVAAFGRDAGVTTLNGRMLDKPHLKLAHRMLAQIT